MIYNDISCSTKLPEAYLLDYSRNNCKCIFLFFSDVMPSSIRKERWNAIESLSESFPFFQMDELDLDAFLTVEEHIPNVTSVNPLGNMSDGSFYPARNVSGRCGLMDENYIQVWQTFQWWCEGVLFSGVGLAGLIANCFSIGK